MQTKRFKLRLPKWIIWVEETLARLEKLSSSLNSLTVYQNSEEAIADGKVVGDFFKTPDGQVSQVTHNNTTSITSSTESETLEIEGTFDFGAVITVAPTYSDDPVTYESSDEEVCTVDEEGLITAIAAGEATVTATSGEESVELTVTVNEP